jgi:hypothetical protein
VFSGFVGRHSPPTDRVAVVFPRRGKLRLARFIFPLRGKLAAQQPVGGKCLRPHAAWPLKGWGGREAAGTNPETVMCCCVSVRSPASQKLFLREDWAKRACFSSDTQEPPYGRAPRSIGYPSRPPTMRDRRVYDPSPCRSTLSHARGFQWSRIYPTNRPPSSPPRDRAAPLSSIPIAASGRIQAPSPRDGDTKSMGRFRSPRISSRKKVVAR